MDPKGIEPSTLSLQGRNASLGTCKPKFSDPVGIRTRDPYIKSVLLYQLSYEVDLINISLICGEEWIWTTDTVLSLDFEVTFDLTTVRRILTKAIFFYVLYQLSYLPKLFVAHRRIELLFQEWKSYVLTDRRMRHFNCSPTGTRTLDPLIKSQLLYQLSYEGM